MVQWQLNLSQNETLHCITLWYWMWTILFQHLCYYYEEQRNFNEFLHSSVELSVYDASILYLIIYK